MSGLDLSSMDLNQLKQLQREVVKAIATFEDRRKSDARAKVADLAKELGFALGDLLEPVGGAKRASASVAKYRHPENPAITWSGRGRKPGWVHDVLAAGGSLDDLAI